MFVGIVHGNTLGMNIDYLLNYDYKVINYNYGGMNGSVSSQFVYNDGFFLQDACQQNGDIAKMAVALAVLSYDRTSLNNVLLDED